MQTWNASTNKNDDGYYVLRTYYVLGTTENVVYLNSEIDTIIISISQISCPRSHSKPSLKSGKFGSRNSLPTTQL